MRKKCSRCKTDVLEQLLDINGFCIRCQKSLREAEENRKPYDQKESITEYLSKLDDWLKENRPDFYSHLQPPATEQELLSFEKKIGQIIPQAFKDLYKWKNGQKGTVVSFFQNYMFLPLSDVEDYWSDLSTMAKAGEFDSENWWKKEWIPFLSNGGGDLLCLNLSLANPGTLIEFWHANEDRDIVHKTMSKMMQEFLKDPEPY